jgi:hypothetical protein
MEPPSLAYLIKPILKDINESCIGEENIGVGMIKITKSPLVAYLFLQSCVRLSMVFDSSNSDDSIAYNVYFTSIVSSI